MQIVKSSKLS